MIIKKLHRNLKRTAIDMARLHNRAHHAGHATSIEMAKSLTHATKSVTSGRFGVALAVPDAGAILVGTSLLVGAFVAVKNKLTRMQAEKIQAEANAEKDREITATKAQVADIQARIAMLTASISQSAFTAKESVYARDHHVHQVMQSRLN
jgi:uncharacterized membrane protein